LDVDESNFDSFNHDLAEDSRLDSHISIVVGDRFKLFGKHHC